MKCPVCNTDNPAGEAFCINCGAALNQTTSTTSAGGGTSSGNAGSVTFGGSGGTSRTLAPNSTLENGRYVIQKILGQGGMGTAMLAKDTRVSNKLVVIKELISENTDPVQRQEDVRNFEREVETLVQIDHPLVPTVTDSFHEGTHYFMVQEYVPGENLEDRMERASAPMPEREALGYGSQVLDILDYLSQQTPPIVHRDIKPANIIIGGKDKRAHLVDFGIARADEAKNAKRKQTSALGTPGYAPPEQYQGNADARSDLYALAATIHYLITNRDPRNYPPFNYPSARSINPHILPETDRILTKALNIDITKRYQTPAAMKRDVDNVLTHNFNLAGDTSSYVLGASGPITTTPSPQPARPQPAQTAQRPPSQPSAQPRQPQPVRPAYPAQSAPRPAPYPQQAGMYANQPARQSGGNGFVRNSLLLLIVVLLLGVGLFVLPNILKSRNTGGATTPGTGGSGAGATPTIGFTAPSNGIGVQPYVNDSIGISDGTYAFDTGSPRTDGDLKTQAANTLKSGDKQGAASTLRQAVATDPSDAEAQIYLEDLNVLNSGKPYVTLVVGTMLSQDNVGVGRDDLQGAYIAQREYNASSKLNGGVQVRLLIASSGSNKTYANLVAQQIVQLAKTDKTFVGVMGWPFSSRTEAALATLRDAHIPMVSQSSSDDSLSGASSYFFRVAPPNKSQGIEGAKYAESTLHAKTVALFVDYSDSYSQSLANDFVNQFKADGNNVVVTEQYKVNAKDTTLPSKLQDALSKKPDLVYFSGYAADVSILLSNLPDNTLSTPILGGDALYELGGYSSGSGSALKYLKFSAFFYPDVWGIIGANNSPKKPAFFSEYSSTFGAGGKTGYGYTRTDSDATLSYDATVAMLNAYNIAAPSGGSITPDALRQALSKTSFQGASGQIAFDKNGDPVDKAIVILKVDSQGRISLDQLLGKFLQ